MEMQIHPSLTRLIVSSYAAMEDARNEFDEDVAYVRAACGASANAVLSTDATRWIEPTPVDAPAGEADGD